MQKGSQSKPPNSTQNGHRTHKKGKHQHQHRQTAAQISISAAANSQVAQEAKESEVGSRTREAKRHASCRTSQKSRP
jgi:hypothetical protein